MYSVCHLLVVVHQAGDIPSGASPGLKYASVDIPEGSFLTFSDPAPEVAMNGSGPSSPGAPEMDQQVIFLSLKSACSIGQLVLSRIYEQVLLTLKGILV